MKILKIHHIQLAMPRGEEAAARHFYTTVLQLKEVGKPEQLKNRGGCWFESDNIMLHLGVDDPFTAAKKAHPAFLVDNLDECIQLAIDAGFTTVDDQPLAGYIRKYIYDPFGNRIEILQKI